MDGSKVSVFDQPFNEKNQNFVETRFDVADGDQLLTTCTFENTSDSTVSFGGPFDNAEMCYAFVLAYPAHALDNGSRSLLGANNACL
jgi:Copper type II ascorbate-dependent monooxygenase, C-terminal domain